MSTRRIRAKAEELQGYGYPRQHMFDTLVLEHPEEKPKRIAQVVRYMPPLVVREEFKQVHQGLLVAIGVGAVLHVLERWTEAAPHWNEVLTLIWTAPIASILLGIALLRWRGEVLPWLAFLNGLGALALLGDVEGLVQGEVVWTEFAGHLLGAATAGLAWYLHKNAFPKPTEVKDPLGQGRSHYVFPPEPGMYRM